MPNLNNIDLVYTLGLLLGLIVGTTVHEFGHAYSALLLGDNTAQRMGRVTLNPVAHFDPVGFIFMVLLAFGSSGFAWGKPTPVNPSNLAGGRRGSSVVSFAGPFANIILAAIVVIPLRFGSLSHSSDLYKVLDAVFTANLLLFAFNLIPIPPLDGFGLISGFVSDSWYRLMAPLQRTGVAVLLVVAFLLPYVGQVIGVPLNFLGRIIGPVHDLVSSLLLGV